MRSNCLLWSLKQKLKYGGQVKLVRAWPLPRFVWVNDKGEAYFFKPENPKRNWWRSLIHKVYFTGNVERYYIEQKDT